MQLTDDIIFNRKFALLMGLKCESDVGFSTLGVGVTEMRFNLCGK